MAVISDYALLGDSHGAALVSSDGSVDWWCPPRFDAPSVFARLLGPTGGFWSIRPLGRYTTSRHYLDGTMVLRTEFHTDSGVLWLTDALSLGAGERGHRIGYMSPHVLLRQVEVVDGAVDVAVEVAARPEYGLVDPTVAGTPVGMEISGAADRLILTADRDLAVDGSLVTGRFTLVAGDSAVFALHHRRAADPPIVPLDGRAALRDTVAAWGSGPRSRKRSPSSPSSWPARRRLCHRVDVLHEWRDAEPGAGCVGATARQVGEVAGRRRRRHSPGRAAEAWTTESLGG